MRPLYPMEAPIIMGIIKPALGLLAPVGQLAGERALLRGATRGAPLLRRADRGQLAYLRARNGGHGQGRQQAAPIDKEPLGPTTFRHESAGERNG
jgi:hypothetical protein